MARQQGDRGDAVTGALIALDLLPSDSHVRPTEDAARAKWTLLSNLNRLQEGVPILFAGFGPNSLVSISTDERHLAISTLNAITIWRIEGGQHVTTLQVRNAHFMLWGKTGLYVLAAVKGSSPTYELTHWPADTWSQDWTEELKPQRLWGNDDQSPFDHASAALVYIDNSNEIKVIDLNHRSQRSVGSNSTIVALYAAPGAKKLVARKQDGAISILDINDPVRVYDLDLGALRDRHSAIAISRDGLSLAVGKRNEFRTYDLETGQQNHSCTADPHHEFSLMVWSHDGRKLLAHSSDAQARVWDPAACAMTMVLHHEAIVSAASFSSSGKKIATASWDGTLKIWDGITGKLLSLLSSQDGALQRVWFLEKSDKVIAASNIGLRTWNIRTSIARAEFSDHQAMVNSATFNAVGKLVASAGFDRSVRVWSTDNGEQIRQIPWSNNNKIWHSVFSPDGLRIIAAGDGDEGAKIWDLSTGEEVGHLRGHSGEIRSVAYSGDGRWIALASWDGTASVWNAATLERTIHFRGFPARAYLHDARFSTASDKLVISGTGKIVIVGLESGKEVMSFPIEGGGALSARFSPDDRRIVIGTSIGRLLLIDSNNGAAIWDVEAASENKWIASVDFNPSGTTIATGSYDGTIRLWNAIDGSEVLQLRNHSNGVTGIRFNRDGKELASSSIDGSVKIIRPVWEFNYESLIEFARQTVTRCLTFDERTRFRLSAEPPQWCFDLSKWPYDQQTWQKWRKLKTDGRNPVYPHGRGRLGLVFEETTSRASTAAIQGALVKSVVAESPAEKIGIMAGDIIVAVDGSRVTTVEEAVDAITWKGSGRMVAIEIERSHHRVSVNAMLGQLR